MKRFVAAAGAIVGLLFFAVATPAEAEPVKTCTTVEQGKNKNWTVTTTEEQRAACPSSTEQNVTVVAEDTANKGGNLPPGQQ